MWLHLQAVIVYLLDSNKQLVYSLLACCQLHTCCFLMGQISTFSLDWISCKLCNVTQMMLSELLGKSPSSQQSPFNVFILISWPTSSLCRFICPSFASFYSLLFIFFSATNPPFRDLHSALLVKNQRTVSNVCGWFRLHLLPRSLCDVLDTAGIWVSALKRLW